MDKFFTDTQMDAILKNAEHKIKNILDRNNYVCRNKNDLPQRDSPIYTEIGHFSEYELTYCIAYELAIRNKKTSQKIESYISKNKTISSVDIEYKELKNLGFTHGSLAYYHTCKIGTMKALKMLDNQNSLKVIYHQDALIVKDERIKETRDGKNLTIEKTSIPNMLSSSKTLYLIDTDGTLQEVVKENVSSGYIPSIEYRLARPKLKFDESKLFNVELNLNLPKNEQIKYITKIVETYEEEPCSVKTYHDYFRSIELSDVELPSGQKKPKAHKYADWLYIYDYYMVAKEISNDDEKSIYTDINIELGLFHKTKEDTYSIESYRKTIIPIMKKLIDEKEYQYLITGLK